MTDELARRLAALREEDALLTALVDSLNEGVLALSERGEVVRINARGRVLLDVAAPVPFATDVLPRNATMREAIDAALAGEATEPTEVQIGGRTLQGVTAVVQNGSPLTYFNDRPLYVADHSRLDSGKLAGAVLHRASPIDMPTFMARLFVGPSVTGHRRVSGFSDVSDVRIRSRDGRGVPLEVDGDWLGDVTEADFGITPGGLTVVA
jgi:PAS domain-containing protein